MRARAALALGALGLVSAVAGLMLYRHLSPSVEPAHRQPRDLRFTDLQGKTRLLSEWQGKTVLVNFWATWCPPCLKEIPLLMDVQDVYGQRGLQVLGPAMDRPEPVRAFVERMKLEYPVFAGDAEVAAAMDALGDAGGALPYSVLISPEGVVVYRKSGEFARDELIELLEKYLP